MQPATLIVRLPKQNKSKSNKPKSKQTRQPQPRIRSLAARTTRALVFCDAPDNNVGITTTVTTFKLFNAVQQLLAAFPQHATPIVQNIAGTNTPSLRSRITVTHLEVDVTIVGSQSNVVLVGDLYNFLRFAYYIEGTPYDGTGATPPVAYLTGQISGTNIQDVQRVLLDHRVALSVQAYAGSQLVPATANRTFRIPVNQSFVFYSSNVGYTQWRSERGNMLLDAVSDSSVTPNPVFSHNTRIFFRFEDN